MRFPTYWGRCARAACVVAALIALTATPVHAQPQAALGGGEYLLGGTFEIDFGFFARTSPSGKSRGRFRQSLIFQDLLVEFHGKVTCFVSDPETGRAWIGGVVTRNLSEHPNFQTEIHQRGKDVWFRVLDTGRSSGEPDRTTFLGFEGGGGIITSEEYCDLQIWPDDNERTHPVTDGKIKVRGVD